MKRLWPLFASRTVLKTNAALPPRRGRASRVPGSGGTLQNFEDGPGAVHTVSLCFHGERDDTPPLETVDRALCCRGTDIAPPAPFFVRSQRGLGQEIDH